VKIRPATRDDVLQWYGNVPATMRAIVAEDDGRVLGIAGLASVGGGLQAFSEIDDALRGHRLFLARAAIAFRGLLAETPGAIVAICSQCEPTAPRLLSWLGFEQCSERGWTRG
jgi:hypothetical protein